MRARIVRKHQLNGVTVIDPAATYIEADVRIGADTILYPGTVLRGSTVIGEDCIIGPQADISDTIIGNRVVVKHSVTADSIIGDGERCRPLR